EAVAEDERVGLRAADQVLDLVGPEQDVRPEVAVGLPGRQAPGVRRVRPPEGVRAAGVVQGPGEGTVSRLHAVRVVALTAAHLEGVRGGGLDGDGAGARVPAEGAAIQGERAALVAATIVDPDPVVAGRAAGLAVEAQLASNAGQAAAAVAAHGEGVVAA